MKLLSGILALSSIALAAAQTAIIGYPSNGDTITPGQELTVQVGRPDTLTGSTEVALVISIAPCGPTAASCDSPYDFLGTTLYDGAFDPQFPTYPYNPSNGYYGPQQNFTVTVPDVLGSYDTLTPGDKALLSVIHFSLVGASPEPLFEILNVTLNVE